MEFSFGVSRFVDHFAHQLTTAHDCNRRCVSVQTMHQVRNAGRSAVGGATAIEEHEVMAWEWELPTAADGGLASPIPITITIPIAIPQGNSVTNP